MYGLGKPRTKLGKFLDENKIKQNDIIRITGLSREVMSNICNNEKHKTYKETKTTIIQALHDLGFSDVKESDVF